MVMRYWHQASRLAVLLAASAYSVFPALAERQDDHAEARRLHNTGQILTLETIIATHRRQHPGGQLLEAELERERGRYIYEIKMLSEDGVVREFKYDARSGELWRVERD